MAYFIRPGEYFWSGVQRITNENTKKAIRALSNTENMHEGVHEARRQFKMIRALFRLTRDDLGPKQFRQKNDFYRDAGRQLSAFRDAEAALETLALLKELFADQLEPETFDHLEIKLKENRSELEKIATGEDGLINIVLRKLKSEASKVNFLQIDQFKSPEIISNLRRVYQRGYTNYHLNLKEVKAETIHEWRKRAKYLRYQMQILKKAWYPLINAYGSELHQLTDYLGDYQNLTVLQGKINEGLLDLATEKEQDFLEITRQHQQKLLDRAFPLARKLYVEEPVNFAERMRGWLDGFVEFE